MGMPWGSWGHGGPWGAESSFRQHGWPTGAPAPDPSTTFDHTATQTKTVVQSTTTTAGAALPTTSHPSTSDSPPTSDTSTLSTTHTPSPSPTPSSSTATRTKPSSTVNNTATPTGNTTPSSSATGGNSRIPSHTFPTTFAAPSHTFLSAPSSHASSIPTVLAPAAHASHTISPPPLAASSGSANHAAAAAAGALSGVFFLLLSACLALLLLRRRARQHVPPSADVEAAFDGRPALMQRVSFTSSTPIVPRPAEHRSLLSILHIVREPVAPVLAEDAFTPLPPKQQRRSTMKTPDVHEEVRRLRAEVGRLRAREAVHSWDAAGSDAEVLPAYSSGAPAPACGVPPSQRW